MINSRSLNDLHPILKDKFNQFKNLCKKNNIDLILTSTYRDNESQNELLKNKKTNAKGGESFHQYRVAFDVAIIENGKLVWDNDSYGLKKWQEVGLYGEQCGLLWAGRWTTFKEMCHFQYTGKEKDYFKSLKHFQSGGKLEDLL